MRGRDNMVSQLRFTYTDQVDKNYTENLGRIDSNKFVENVYSSDTAVKRAFLQDIDSSCRAIAALTTNTYRNAEITSVIDVNEELVPGEGE